MSKLVAAQLAKAYGKRVIIENVSLSLESEQIVGLLGPNGAGKTTCFYMIVGLVQQDRGQVLIDDRDVTKLPMHGRAREGIGYLPQEASIFRRLSVQDNIMAILELNKKSSKSEQKQKLKDLLEEFNIGHLAKSLGMSLSGGERRRVEIARALASNPSFILLDEPFAGVDPISVSDIKAIIHQLKGRGLGVLITDHNVRETLDICEKAYIVSEGKIISYGTPQEILNNKKVREVYLGDHFQL